MNTVKHNFPLFDFLKKMEKKGCAKCTLCIKEINYASRGVHALYAHCKADIHQRKVTKTITTQSVAQLLRNPPPETP